MSTLDHKFEPEPPVTVRRLEVITGTGRRRRFSEDDKARVVEETLVPGAVVSEVARRHGLTPQQVFTWRRQARQAGLRRDAPKASMFVPAVIETPPPEQLRRGRRKRQTDPPSGRVEVEIDGITVRVGRGAEAKTIAAVLRALKDCT